MHLLLKTMNYKRNNSRLMRNYLASITHQPFFMAGGKEIDHGPAELTLPYLQL